VNLNNIREYFKHGVIGVGIGSNIVNKTMIENRDFKGLIELAKQYVELANKEE